MMVACCCLTADKIFFYLLNFGLVVFYIFLCEGHFAFKLGMAWLGGLKDLAVLIAVSLICARMSFLVLRVRLSHNDCAHGIRLLR